MMKFLVKFRISPFIEILLTFLNNKIIIFVEIIKGL